MENTLTANTDFGIFIEFQNYSDSDYRRIRNNYDNFLGQPLSLWQFVPCDEEGNVLQEPKMDYYDSMTGWNCHEDARNYENKVIAYNKAKERCLFEGFGIAKSKIYGEDGQLYLTWPESQGKFADIPFKPCTWLGGHSFTNIESLIPANKNLTLSPTALKQIYG